MFSKQIVNIPGFDLDSFLALGPLKVPVRIADPNVPGAFTEVSNGRFQDSGATDAPPDSLKRWTDGRNVVEVRTTWQFASKNPYVPWVRTKTAVVVSNGQVLYIEDFDGLGLTKDEISRLQSGDPAVISKLAPGHNGVFLAQRDDSGSILYEDGNGVAQSIPQNDLKPLATLTRVNPAATLANMTTLDGADRAAQTAWEETFTGLGVGNSWLRKNEDGSIDLVSSAGDKIGEVKTSDFGNTLTVAVGSLVKTISVQSNGDRKIVTTTADGKVIETAETTTEGAGRVTRYFDGSQALTKTAVETRAGDGTSTRDISYADGSTVSSTIDKDRRLIAVTGKNAPLDALGTAISDINNLVTAIKRGDPVPILSSGLTLINNQVNPFIKDPAGGGTQAINNQPLFTTTAVAGAVNSLYGLYNVFANGGSTLQKLSATAGALVSVNNAANAIASQATGDLATKALGETVNGAASAIGKALPWISVAASLQQGDYKGAAVGIASAMGVPYIGWAYAAYMLVSSILHEEPDAWGQARFKFGSGTDVTLDTTGYGIGLNKVNLLMSGNGLAPTDPNYFGGLLGYLNGIVDQANQAAPDMLVGIIPQRLPKLSWNESRRSDPGFSVADIDPMTGEMRFPNLRYDDTYRIVNGDATDPDQRPDLFNRLVQSALNRQAIAPMWEVNTARMQQDYGNPEAGLTEEERAARHGWSATTDAAGKKNPGKFRPVVLDLDGDGIISTTSKDASGVSFDWDGSGYLKNTAWIKGSEGILVLDRNLNGIADSGSELFSNSNVIDDAKGVRSMRWVDANGDGVIDANDPVYQALRVWRDTNQDGRQDGNETFGLAELGITRLDYNNNRFTKNGTDYALKSQDLDASTDGMAVSVVNGGIQIDYSNGKSTLLVTQVIDMGGGSGQGTDFTARDDFVDSWEDGVSPGNDLAHPRQQQPTDHQPIGIAFGLLLDNDFNKGSHDGLTITAVSDATHGTVSINRDAGTVDFLPDHNYVGDASFTYTVTDAQGRTRTALVKVALKPVNDAPVVSDPVMDELPIYGYTSLATREQNMQGGEDAPDFVLALHSGQGLPMYSPYQTVMGRPILRDEAWVGYGDPVDTGITVGYFASEFAKFVHMYGGGEDGVRGMTMKIDGAEFMIDGDPPLAYHGTPIGTEKSNDGRIIATNADGTPGNFRFEMIDKPKYGEVTVDRNTGRFVYTGNRYVELNVEGGLVGENRLTDEHFRNEERTEDAFYVKVIDQNDSTGQTFTTQKVTVTHFGPLPGGEYTSGGKKPIAIDLNGDGFHFKDVDDSNVFFDVNGDGWKRRMAWNNGSDGFIAFDKNGDGKIADFDEISFVPYKAGAQSDLEGLAAFDTNHDGKFSAADEKWSSFGVWQDANENGITDAGEFRSLDSLGINAIQLGSDGRFQVIDGQSVHGVGSATRTDGGSYALADVTLRYRNETQGQTDQGQTVTAPVAPFASGQTFNGTEGADLVFGTAGSDQYHMGAGNDVVSDGDGDDAVEAGDGNDIVMTGAGNDYVDGGNGNDQIFTDVGDDVVLAGNGDDFVTAGDGNDIVFGGEGQDMLSGGNGNDLLSGDQGDDQLFGESGRDVLFGMDGDDQLFGGENDDQLDGGAGNDLLDGGTGADVMIGGAGNDRYAVDNVGDVVTEAENGGYDSVTVDNLADYTLGANVEALVLGKNAMNGTGNALDNALWGNDAANRLDGREGADTMAGGAGDDTYVVDNAGDQVVEYANKGNDTVLSSIDYTLGANVENLVLSGNAVKGTGNQQDNRITGNDMDNVLAGGGGRDTLIGGRGNDHYVVDGADDVIVEQYGEGVDSVESSVSYTLGANIENLTLTGTGNLDGIGNAGNNVIIGTSGNNRIDGGAGADTLIGGEGDDTYIVDNVGDVVVELAGEGHDTVESSVDYTLADGLEDLRLKLGAHVGIGNAADNVIEGLAMDGSDHGDDGRVTMRGEGGNDTLISNLGGDRMIGGTGDDTYVINKLGFDGEIIEAADEGIDTVRSYANIELSANVENLTLLGYADRGVGNELANVIIAAEHGSQIFGLAGDDTLVGNAGDDLLDGGTGADLMSGGGGDDRYVVDDAGDVVVEEAGGGGNAETQRVIDGIKSSWSWLPGGAGIVDAVVDYVRARPGQEIVWSDMITDIEQQGVGDTWILMLYASQFQPLLTLDYASGGTGGGNDTVTASIDYTLTDNVENLILAGSADLSGTGNALDNELIGNAGNNRLDGGAGADLMAGGRGDDVYIVDNAGDRIVEGVAGDRPWSEGLRLATEELKRLAGDDGWSGNIDGAMAQVDAALTAAAAEGVTDVFAVNLSGIVREMVFSEAQLANKVRSLLWDRLSMVAPEGGTDGGHDVVYASVNFEAGLGIEDVVLTGDAISATGNALDNRLTGNAMDNELTGGDGNDHLFGGEGNDLIIGGTGNDTLVGGTGDDVFAWADGDGFDVVTDESGQDVLSFGEGLTADSFDYVTEEIDGQQRTTLIRLDAEGHATAEGVQLNGSAATGFEIEEIRFADGTTRSVQDLLAAIDTRKQPIDDGSQDFVGTDGDDTFYLSDAPRGVINRYHGGGGTDTILGGWGYDYLNVAPDLGNLQSIEVLDGVGSDFRSNFIWGTDGADRWDFSGMTVRNFVMASGAGDDTIIGTAGDDMIEGGKGTDDLSGGDGNDTFILTAGDDGVDRYDGGSGDNRIYADWGYNVLRVSSTLDSLRNIQRIESVDNNFGAARIVATDGDDTLDFTGILVRNFMIDAGDGNDVVIGGDGDEWIRGGKGADILSGGAGNDTFLLTPGDYEVDHFDGGLGSNRIFADWGTTVLRVGSTLASVQNIQKIEGVETTLGAARIVSTDGDDTLDFSGITVKNFLIDTGDGNDVVIGGDGDDWIRGGKGSDVLSGGAGDDMFVLTAGDEGVDRYDGGSGTNRIFADWGYNVLRVSSTMDSLRNIQRIESVDANFGAARIVATDGDDTLDFTGISLKNFMIDTGDGDDVVTGSADADTIRGGKGRDTLSGGGGDDLYLWQKGDGDDHISDTAGDNTLDLGSYLDPAGVTVATTETGWQLQVRHDGQMSLLTIDRYQASTMKVRIDSNTWSIDSLPAGDYVTPWDASGGAAMAKGAGWASMDAGDSQRLESDHATTGLIGGGSSPRRSTTL
ncbi:Ig-like domain-containing protein [Roseateles chitinivorans]|uniref:Ig-like domain-containing protein n=1 Tax=Roseateles chitinivorans TaxID=2917965 RepID=UPI003D6645CD